MFRHAIGTEMHLVHLAMDYRQVTVTAITATAEASWCFGLSREDGCAVTTPSSGKNRLHWLRSWTPGDATGTQGQRLVSTCSPRAAGSVKSHDQNNCSCGDHQLPVRDDI